MQCTMLFAFLMFVFYCLSLTKEKCYFRKHFLCIDNEEVKLFWTERFHNMPSSDIERAYGKLRRFLQPKKISMNFFAKTECYQF